MRRREFITLLGAGAMAWPFAARAQQSERTRRIGVLLDFAADDSEGQARLAAFVRALADLGWTADRNVRIESRSGATDVDRVRRHAAELVALAPDVVLAGGATALRSLQQATATVPIVFAGVTDPVGGGMVASLAKPGGNSTGAPIVETPADALACFLATGIDYLALQDMLIAKNQFHSILSPFTRAFSEMSTIVRTGLSADMQAG